MLQSMQNIVPAEWSGTVEVLATPIAWLPTWQTALINFAWYGGTVGEVVIKRGLLLMPIMLLVAAMWSTMVSLYTLPFRSGRGGFLIALSTAWWDAGRTIWFFWAGVLRLGVVVIGWVLGLVRLSGAPLSAPCPQDEGPFASAGAPVPQPVLRIWRAREHTREVLEECGYSHTEIDALAKAKSVFVEANAEARVK